MLNIYIITQREPFYIPKMILHLLQNQKQFCILGYTTLKPTRKNKSIFHWINERMKLYNTKEVLIVSLTFIYITLLKTLFPTRNSYSAKAIFSKYQIKELQTVDINNDQFLDKLALLNPDIILSISCPQLFRERILSLPTKYCINAHGTLLPRHRGVFGSFWTLFNNDREAGSTLHTMELKLDAGKILWQQEFKVQSYDTQYSIAYKTKKQMAEGLVDLFNTIDNGRETHLPSKYQMSYHRAPTSKEGREFHRMNRKIIKLKDVNRLLSKTFI